MSENTISGIRLNGTTYLINDTSKASNESVLEFGRITTENNSLLSSANLKLDELLFKLGNSSADNLEDFSIFKIVEYYPEVETAEIIESFTMEHKYSVFLPTGERDDNGDLILSDEKTDVWVSFDFKNDKCEYFGDGTLDLDLFLSAYATEDYFNAINPTKQIYWPLSDSKYVDFPIEMKDGSNEILHHTCEFSCSEIKWRWCTYEEHINGDSVKRSVWPKNYPEPYHVGKLESSFPDEYFSTWHINFDTSYTSNDTELPRNILGAGGIFKNEYRFNKDSNTGLSPSNHDTRIYNIKTVSVPVNKCIKGIKAIGFDLEKNEFIFDNQRHTLYGHDILLSKSDYDDRKVIGESNIRVGDICIINNFRPATILTNTDEKGETILDTYVAASGNILSNYKVDSTLNLYKCLESYNNMTWTGQLISEKNGKYVFSNTHVLLSYSNGLKPRKGRIYTADARQNINKVYDHCICNFPCNKSYSDLQENCKIEMRRGDKPENQVLLEYKNCLSLGTCVHFNTTYIYETSLYIKNLPVLNEFTLEFFHYRENTPGSKHNYLGLCVAPAYLTQIVNNCEQILFGTEEKYQALPVGQWFHHTFVRDHGSSFVREYVNGVLYDVLFYPFLLGEDYSTISSDTTLIFSVQPALYNPDNSLYTTQKRDGYHGVIGGSPHDHISNLSIWDIAKYKSNFEPPQLKYPVYKSIWEDKPYIIISNAGIDEINGKYESVTPDAQSNKRVWLNVNNPNISISYDEDWWSWTIANRERVYYRCEEGASDLCDSEWWDATDDEIGGEPPVLVYYE